jgi:redox-sensitive bicupin YhaK (pirin superfamily)
VKVIAGVVGDARGPISQPATDPLYLDIGLEAGRSWEYVLPEGHNAFAYVFEGGVVIGDGDEARKLGTHEMAVLGGGDVFKVSASNDARLILVAGRPLREPVVRYGPFVMNTKQEIMQAFVDFQEGRF